MSLKSIPTTKEEILKTGEIDPELAEVRRVLRSPNSSLTVQGSYSRGLFLD